MGKLVNFFMDEKLKKELDILAAREGRSIKDILNEQIEKYVEVHKEGNPQHQIDRFMDNEDFIGFPSIAIDYDKKQSYLLKNCVEPDDKERMNQFGKELWSHVTQWYELMRKL